MCAILSDNAKAEPVYSHLIGGRKFARLGATLARPHWDIKNRGRDFQGATQHAARQAASSHTELPRSAAAASVAW